jgi:large subunit ribosomal protein L13Ae
VVIVDAKGHLIGRLASLLAKELMNGQRVVVVRCEELNVSGSLFRNKRNMQHRVDQCNHVVLIFNSQIPRVPEPKNQHQSAQGPLPFQSPFSDFVQGYPRHDQPPHKEGKHRTGTFEGWFSELCAASWLISAVLLQVFDGIPHPYDRMKRKVVPDALRVTKLRPGRKFCRLGDLSATMGWSAAPLISRLEDKRKEKSAAYYATKKVRF